MRAITHDSDEHVLARAGWSDTHDHVAELAFLIVDALVLKLPGLKKETVVWQAQQLDASSGAVRCFSKAKIAHLLVHVVGGLKAKLE